MAIVVEKDTYLRSLATVLLEETGLIVVECESAEDAISVLRSRANDTAFLFADQDIARSRDGLDLASVVTTLWPGVRVAVT